MNRFASCIFTFFLFGSTVVAASHQAETNLQVQSTYQKLINAKEWRQAQEASKKLAAYGPAALTWVLKGTKHQSKLVRKYCFERLYDTFPTERKAVSRIIEGVSDPYIYGIAYPCAFHLGEHKIKKAEKTLRRVLSDPNSSELLRYSTAKSLAEIGKMDVFVVLYIGLGSDSFYPRYLSNIGIKALCGKDLTDFGYKSPTEGAFVSGPAVVRVKGLPIEKAKRKVERWQAILAFAKWLKAEHPKLFKQLENAWL